MFKLISAMAPNISVPVLYDQNGQFLGVGGVLRSVSALSVANGIVPKPNGYAVPPLQAPMIDTLEIKDPNIGTMYILMTVNEFQEATTKAVYGTINAGDGVVEVSWRATGAATVTIPENCRLLLFAAKPIDNVTESIAISYGAEVGNVLPATQFKQNEQLGHTPAINYFGEFTAATLNIDGAVGEVEYKVMWSTPHNPNP